MSLQLGVRRVNLTARKFFDDHELAAAEVEDLKSLDAIQEFPVQQSVDDHGLTVALESDNRNWLSVGLINETTIQVTIQFMGDQKDWMLSALEDVFTVIEAAALSNADIELRLNTAFDKLEQLPIAEDTDLDVKGIEISHGDWLYRFAHIGQAETVIIGELTEEQMMRAPIGEFYTDQLNGMVDFVTDFAPSRAHA